MQKLFVQYGCHHCAPKTWQNFDASPTLRFERFPILGRLYTKNPTRFPKNVEYGDIVKGLPLSSNSCNGIYASHILEHLALEDFRVALKNTYQLLRPGGIFRLVVPDLEILAKNYVESDLPDAAEKFMQATSLGIVRRSRSLLEFLKLWLGNSSHLWMWDYKSLEHELHSIGFKGIRRAFYGDCKYPEFMEVENPERFKDAVCVECRK